MTPIIGTKGNGCFGLVGDGLPIAFATAVILMSDVGFVGPVGPGRGEGLILKDMISQFV